MVQPWENLEVFWLAEEYEAYIEHVMPRIAEASPNDADQLNRAASSISNNIAEAAPNHTRAERNRFFGYSRRSAAECHIVFRRLSRKGVITEGELRISYYYSDRLGASLYNLMNRKSG